MQKKTLAARKPSEHRLGELESAMRREEARVEAERCLYCYDAPCVTACPTHIEIPRFIKQIASGDKISAATTILEANPLGHSCARVCPVEVLCEGSCVYLAWHEKPIEIGRLQRAATDALHEERLQPFAAGKSTGKRVAVVGAGPAGLSCAFYLRRLGHSVTVYDKAPLAGGLNTYGVAEYKMDQETAQDEVGFLSSLGIDIALGVEVGKDLPFKKLTSDFDAVFVGCGLGGTNSLGVPGEGKKGVLDALTFIERVKSGKSLPPGQVTVVIGAGNTSIDAVTQSKRTGTPRVVMAYRRSEAEMSAYGFEYDLAKQDGAEFLWNAAPVAVLGGPSVVGVRFVKTRTKNGRLESVKGSEFTVPCDRVIKAIGQEKRRGWLAKVGISTDASGRIIVDPETLATSNERVFAGGDAINGGKEVVNAAQDGKRAALGIQAFFGRKLAPADIRWAQTLTSRVVGAS